MRNKVLTEITEKNRLKEEMKEMRAQHRKELALQTKKFEGVESLYRKLQEEQEDLKLRHPRRDNRTEAELEKLSAKVSECESKLQREREANRHLQTEKRQLTDRLEELEEELAKALKGESERKRRQPGSEAVANSQQQREIENLKVQIERLNGNIAVREV